MTTAAAGAGTESKEGWSVAGKSHEEIIHCTRCGGLMVTEQFIDLPAHRCVQCGEIVDPVILQNRQRGITTGMN